MPASSRFAKTIPIKADHHALRRRVRDTTNISKEFSNQGHNDPDWKIVK
jgi:hypothetical protein